MSEPPFSLDRPILILGGGINGAAAARELTLNGYSVLLVDQADLACGATAYSSRLVHGGLRYLEHGEFDLVKESLGERTRLLSLATDFVRPLRLFIPVKSRWGGVWQSAARFWGMNAGGAAPKPRGLALVRMGLWLYDTYARDKTLPNRSVHPIGSPGTPPVTASAARWLAAYSDAQIPFPERFVIALLRDAAKAADENGCSLRVLTYHRARLEGNIVHVSPVTPAAAVPALSLQPATIINATGAWVDETLQRLPVSSRRLMGGSKGSHFFTWHAGLKEKLGGNGIYTEAADGRPVFLLPLAEGTLAGTTDLPFSGDPATAVATEEELNYLVAVVESIFPDAGLTREDIAWHYSGVRPLPYVDAATPAAITRRHQLVWNDSSPIPLVSLVGGKLTTCRSLAEETAAQVLTRLGEERKDIRNSRARVIPGGVLEKERTRDGESESVRRIIRDEWVTTLDDLVERRLMLLYDPDLSRARLVEVAHLLQKEGKLPADQLEQAVEDCAGRLQSHFGLKL